MFNITISVIFLLLRIPTKAALDIGYVINLQGISFVVLECLNQSTTNFWENLIGRIVSGLDYRGLKLSMALFNVILHEVGGKISWDY